MLSSLLFTLASSAPQAVTPDTVSGSVCIHTDNPKTPPKSDIKLPVTFQNSLDISVDVCWSNFAGKLVNYGTLKPNGAIKINTFAGHVWSIRQTADIGCNGAPLTDPFSFQNEGVKDIKELKSTCSFVTPPATNQTTVQVKKTAANQLGLSDYQELEKSLKDKFLTPANIPKLVRMSFHDLANFDPATNAFGGAHGCIFNQTVMSFSENNGLGPTAANLTAFMETNFPKKDFPIGDVISLAGKVAVETAFPGTSIKWRFGRSACKQDQVAGKTLAPSSDIATMKEMQPFLDRYSLSANEMAILTSGAHALAGAQNFQKDTQIIDFAFSAVNSGIQFIKDSQDLTKVGTFFQTWYGSLQTTPVFGRFPSDMLFFPSTISKISSAASKSDPAALPVEKFLNSIPDDASFNAQFATVYAKMLEIGVATETLTAFN